MTALPRLAPTLAGRINSAVAPAGDAQVRNGLTVGESLVAAMIASPCAPRRTAVTKAARAAC